MIDLVGPEDNALIESPEGGAPFTVALDNCKPQPRQRTIGQYRWRKRSGSADDASAAGQPRGSGELTRRFCRRPRDLTDRYRSFVLRTDNLRD